MSKETGGHAFPSSISIGPSGDVYTSGSFSEGGMTLRDYMAIKAMSGVLSCPGTGINIGPSHLDEMKALAGTFYLMADAMLEARK